MTTTPAPTKIRIGESDFILADRTVADTRAAARDFVLVADVDDLRRLAMWTSHNDLDEDFFYSEQDGMPLSVLGVVMIRIACAAVGVVSPSSEDDVRAVDLPEADALYLRAVCAQAHRAQPNR